MRFTLHSNGLAAERPLLAWLVTEEDLTGEGSSPLGAEASTTVARLVRGGDFEGSPSELAILYPNETGPERVVLAGLGKRADAGLETIRRAAGAAARRSIRTLGSR